MKLVIHEDGGKQSNPKEYSKEAILSGNSSILNLDKDHSKLFIGGLPATFNEQADIVGQSLEGRVEDLMLGNTLIGLWNFVDSSGYNNGSVERYSQIFIRICLSFLRYENNINKIIYFTYRNSLTVIPSTSGYRMNGEGFVILESKYYEMKQKSSILLNIKTKSTDGLLFLAFKNNNFMSIELEGGYIVYRVSIYYTVNMSTIIYV